MSENIEPGPIRQYRAKFQSTARIWLIGNDDAQFEEVRKSYLHDEYPRMVCNDRCFFDGEPVSQYDGVLFIEHPTLDRPQAWFICWNCARRSTDELLALLCARATKKEEA